ncbi:hypothetical protein [Mycolicibacillus trivialis]|uniref:Mce protein n=1 Tax=Mycolicibacillus trivialis TaxID=1798 RepID=A0A1X2ENC5_9MYCO|nr:hypothetical protein [Mycolicibacillus trivialis]ORX07038.1 hypothetical protein AWC30_05635 [Mycolicibacillus trivialis]
MSTSSDDESAAPEDAAATGVEPVADSETGTSSDTDTTQPDTTQPDTTQPDAPQADARRWIRVLARCAAAVAAIAVVAGAGYAGWSLFDQHRRDSSAAQALDAASAFAVTLTTADPSTVDDKVRAVIDGSTGDFHDRYTKSSAQLRKLLIDNAVTTRGTVLDIAVKSAQASQVEVLLVVSQSVSNSSVPDAGSDLVPVAITMEEVDGRWLASEVVVFGAEQ